MDGLETSYDDSLVEDFIECGICNTSSRGDTQYKIHLTTIQHKIKEDSLIATGKAIRDHELPDFKDIKEYLRYLRLDEPIIGLNDLEEVNRSATDPQPGPRYICRLCDLEANLPVMVNHVVGRRHRQRYLEGKRKDLVTWKSQGRIMARPGKIIRAKAEVVERQDGQGSPKPLRKNRNVGKSNLRILVPKKQRGDQNRPLGFVKQGFLPHTTEGRDHQGPPGNDPYFHEQDAYGFERSVYLADDSRRCDYMEEEPRRPDYPDEDLCRREFLEASDYLEEGPSRPGHQEDVPPRRQTYPEDVYHEEGPRRRPYPENDPHRRPYPENDPLKQFYSQEVQRRGAARSVEAPQDRAFHEAESHGRGRHVGDPCGPASRPQEDGGYYEDPHGLPHGRGYHEEMAGGRGAPEDPYSEDACRGSYREDEAHRRAYPEEEPHRVAYPEANRGPRQSQDRDPGGCGYTEPADWQAAGVPEVSSRQGFSEQPGQGEGSYSRDHLFELIKAFRQEGRGPPPRQGGWGQRQEEVERGPGGPSMRGPPPQRPPEGGRVRLDIPEPFRHFLAGAVADKGPEKRKRKSRFSDATNEEIDMVKRMQVDEYRGPNTDPHAKPQGVYQAGGYPGANFKTMSESSSDVGNIFDVLNNTEIANVEEANFLKEKLCGLLKEFQAKKLEKAAVHTSQGPPVISRDYNHMSNAQGEPARDHHKGTCREMPEERRHEIQPRRPQERYSLDGPQGSYRGGSREEEEHGERGHNRRPEPKGERRTHYEAVFGQAEQYPPPHARPEEPGMYRERPESSMYPHDYPPASEEIYNPFPPTGSLRREYGYRMNPVTPRSTSLDKITATLLELVARKSS